MSEATPEPTSSTRPRPARLQGGSSDEPASTSSRPRPARLERGASLASSALNRIANAFVGKVTNSSDSSSGFSKSFDASASDTRRYQNMPFLLCHNVYKSNYGKYQAQPKQYTTVLFL